MLPDQSTSPKPRTLSGQQRNGETQATFLGHNPLKKKKSDYLFSKELWAFNFWAFTPLPHPPLLSENKKKGKGKKGKAIPVE